MASPDLGASLDLFDIEKPVVVLRLSRGAAQALARGDMPDDIRRTLMEADRRIHSNLQLRAGQLKREGEELLEKSRLLRGMR